MLFYFLFLLRDNSFCLMLSYTRIRNLLLSLSVHLWFFMAMRSLSVNVLCFNDLSQWFIVSLFLTETLIRFAFLIFFFMSGFTFVLTRRFAFVSLQFIYFRKQPLIHFFQLLNINFGVLEEFDLLGLQFIDLCFEGVSVKLQLLFNLSLYNNLYSNSLSDLSLLLLQVNLKLAVILFLIFEFDELRIHDIESL